MDPAQFSNKDEFVYKYNIAFGFSKACSEILQMIEQAKGTAIYLQDKKDGKLKNNFAIGKE